MLAFNYGIFQVIENVPTASGHKELDLFVLFILHNNYKKNVESLFRTKIRCGHFTNVFLNSVFQQHHEVNQFINRYL